MENVADISHFDLLLLVSSAFVYENLVTSMANNLDLRVDGAYQLQRRLGTGTWGAVYQGVHIKTRQEFAIKLEQTTIDPSMLESEAVAYKLLEGNYGIPRIHWDGEEPEFRMMVLDLLGPSLEDLFNFCHRKFSLKTVLMLADQLIRCVESVHAARLVHRDIKPENFLMGVGRQGNQVYITDLGFTGLGEYTQFEGEWEDGRSRKPNLVGTALFASVNAHYGIAQCRRDDLEALGYLFVYFLRGSLPWQNLKAMHKKEEWKLMLEMKKTISTQDLCEGLPDEFKLYLDNLRRLSYGEEPQYRYLRGQFRSLFQRNGFEKDNVYDWTILRFCQLIEAEQSPSKPSST